MLSLMSMEHEILGDTHLETIINDFAWKKCGTTYRWSFICMWRHLQAFCSCHLF